MRSLIRSLVVPGCLLAVASFSAAKPVPCPAGGVDLTRPPYSARADGSADSSAAFRAAVGDPEVRVICLPPGTFRLDEQVLMRTGQDLGLLGLSTDPSETRIVWKQGLMPFFSSPTRGADTRIRKFFARNLTFDGNHGDGRALNLLAVAGATDTSVELENVVIQNTTNLPIWLEGFDHVRIARSKFLRTKDPGILRSRRVEIVDNEVQDSSDNCFSVSRGNSHVLVARNRVRNCHSAGIFLGGINYDGSPSRSFVLDAAAGATPGTACVLRSPGADYFRLGMIGTNLTLRRGDAFVIVRIDGWDEGNRQAAPCTLVTSVPPSLAKRSTSEWSDGPHFGGEHAVIEDNVIEGTRGHGITLSLGVSDVKVRRNTVRDSGRFVGRDGALEQKASFGVLVLGWYLGSESGAQRYAEDIEITENSISGATMGGIRLGSEATGGVRRTVVRGNVIDLSASNGAVGVLVDSHPQMPGTGNQVSDNAVTFSRSATTAIALRIDASPADACRAVPQAAVASMVNGSCALRVGKECVARRAPASLACVSRRP